MADLMAKTGWNLDQSIGKLHRLWWWCMDYAEDGDLRRHTAARIASAVGVKPDRGAWVIKTLTATGWLDPANCPYVRIHDWWQYAGPFLRSKYKRTPAKWERIRNLYVTVATHDHLTKPNQPNLTKPTSPDFEAFWAAYPKKAKRDEATAAWDLLAPSVALFSRIAQALDHQKGTARWLKDDGQYIPNADKWLNEKRWEESPVQVAAAKRCEKRDCGLSSNYVTGTSRDGKTKLCASCLNEEAVELERMEASR